MSGPELIKRHCSVPGCFRRSVYFSLPDDEEKCKKWLKLINRTDLDTDDIAARVCETHFDPSCIIYTISGMALMRDAYPKYNLPKSYISKVLSFFTLPKRSSIVTVDKGVQTRPCFVNVGRSFDSLIMRLRPVTDAEEYCTCKLINRDKERFEGKSEYEIFCYLSDKFLSKNLSRAVRKRAIVAK